VSLHQHTSKTQREIAHDVGVSQNAVSGIIRLFQSTGSTATNRKGKCGRKCKLSKRELAILVRESKRNPLLTARQVKNIAGEVGQNVSLRTTQRLLTRAGRLAYKPIRAPQLTLNHRVLRRQWATAHRNLSMDFWDKVKCAVKFHTNLVIPLM
jgi:transposase